MGDGDAKRRKIGDAVTELPEKAMNFNLKCELGDKRDKQQKDLDKQLMDNRLQITSLTIDRVYHYNPKIPVMPNCKKIKLTIAGTHSDPLEYDMTPELEHLDVEAGISYLSPAHQSTLYCSHVLCSFMFASTGSRTDIAFNWTLPLPNAMPALQELHLCRVKIPNANLDLSGFTQLESFSMQRMHAPKQLVVTFPSSTKRVTFWTMYHLKEVNLAKCDDLELIQLCGCSDQSKPLTFRLGDRSIRTPDIVYPSNNRVPILDWNKTFSRYDLVQWDSSEPNEWTAPAPEVGNRFSYNDSDLDSNSDW